MLVPGLNQLPESVHLRDLTAKSLAAVTDHTRHLPIQNDLRVCVRWSIQRQQLHYSALIKPEKLQSFLSCYLNVEQGWLLLGLPLTNMGCCKDVTQRSQPSTLVSFMCGSPPIFEVITLLAGIKLLHHIF